ncbi:MAG: hypothetical protein Q7U74_02945, partial [Saprospiraceae bacterium]|nr:hypothetical protein [Saprospiraceae bacterium]
GGSKPQSPDGKVGDGYETLVFDSGRGEDPDLAWVRVNPTDGASIEFAFKTTLLPSNLVFAWWAWTSLENFEPARMEFVDSYSESEVWKVDNTCSWIFNGKPTNILTNICEFVVPTPLPTITPTPRVQGCVVKTDAQCNAAADPNGGGFPWWFDITTCKCRPTN